MKIEVLPERERGVCCAVELEVPEVRAVEIADVLKALVSGNRLTAGDDARETRIAELGLVDLAALASELERDAGARDLDVLVAKRRESERVIGARILFVADAHAGLVDEAHDERDHFVFRQTRRGQIALHASTTRAKGVEQSSHRSGVSVCPFSASPHKIHTPIEETLAAIEGFEILSIKEEYEEQPVTLYLVSSRKV